MASIGHVAVGLAASRFYQPMRRPWLATLGSMALWSGLSLLPDVDVIGFKLGVAYGAPWGHRGATHSFVFAMGVGLIVAVVARLAGLPVVRTALLATAVVISHGLLDVLTDGGLGCALLWPFSHERYFAPWRPIPVSPIGLRFVSARGLAVAATELLFFAVPIVYGFWPRRRRVAEGSRR